MKVVAIEDMSDVLFFFVGTCSSGLEPGPTPVPLKSLNKVVFVFVYFSQGYFRTDEATAEQEQGPHS